MSEIDLIMEVVKQFTFPNQFKKIQKAIELKKEINKNEGDTGGVP